MKISNEAKVGVLVFTVFVALGVLTFRTGDFSLSKKGYTVKVHFENIDGVGLNAPVMLNGLEVGKVEAITILEEAESTKLELLAQRRRSAERNWQNESDQAKSKVVLDSLKSDLLRALRIYEE